MNTARSRYGPSSKGLLNARLGMVKSGSQPVYAPKMQ